MTTKMMTSIQLRCSGEEKELWKELAKADGLDLSNWIRFKLNTVDGLTPALDTLRDIREEQRRTRELLEQFLTGQMSVGL